jgi:hypothetical protein
MNGDCVDINSLLKLEASNDSPSEKISFSKIETLLLEGKREDAVEEAIRSKNFIIVLLVGLMSSCSVFQMAAREYSQANFSHGHPLNILCMLFSGNLRPESASSFWNLADPKILCNTWCNHLAAIISNRTKDWEYIVISLGDRLMSLGDVTAAHFCYMVCGCPIASPHRSDSRLTLLGCDVTPFDLILNSDSSIIAMERTEAYEWSKRRGNHNAVIPSLQPFKLMYAMLLADYGFERSAFAYTQNIIKCMGASSVDAHFLEPPKGPLGFYLLLSDQKALVAAVGDFERRLSFRGCADTISETPPNDNDEDIYGEQETNKSFVTARTQVNDGSLVAETSFDDYTYATSSAVEPIYKDDQEPEPRDNKEKSFPPQNDATRELTNEYTGPPQPPQQFQFRTPDNFSTSEATKMNGGFFSEIKPHSQPSGREQAGLTDSSTSSPGASLQTVEEREKVSTTSGPGVESQHKSQSFISPPATTGSQPNAARTSSSNNQKPRAAPMSAPANLEQSSKRGGIMYGIRSWMTKRLNPDATEADLGGQMEAYYDKEKKVWVFPGEDPAELAKPVGPPPITPLASDAPPASFKPTPDSRKIDDPLAAMMAPPTRVPSSLRSKSLSTKPMSMMYTPGMMPGSAMQTNGSTPQFSVFAPPPISSTKESDNE